MPASTDFPGLTAEERSSLALWWASTRGQEIDAITDLTGRQWNVPETRDILGLFRRGETRAAWLIVREDVGWSLLDCEAEAILGGVLTLGEALSLIIP